MKLLTMTLTMPRTDLAGIFTQGTRRYLGQARCHLYAKFCRRLRDL